MGSRPERIRTIILSLPLLLAACASIGASCRADDAGMSGLWTFEPKAFKGTMELRVSREGNEWKAQARFTAGERQCTNALRDLKVDGKGILSTFFPRVSSRGLVYPGSVQRHRGEKHQEPDFVKILV
jgi:hypothetical protein